MTHKAAIKISSDSLAGLKGTSFKIDIREAGVGKVAVLKTHISKAGFIEETAYNLQFSKAIFLKRSSFPSNFSDKHSLKTAACNFFLRYFCIFQNRNYIFYDWKFHRRFWFLKHLTVHILPTFLFRFKF